MKMLNYFIAPIKDGLWPNCLTFCLAMIFIVMKLWILATLFVFLFLFVFFFFRFPSRKMIAESDAIISSADGKILKIEKNINVDYMKGKVNKIVVFMSPFNMHRNFSPIKGEIEDVCYMPGEFLPAYSQDVELVNERNRVVFKNDKLIVSVTQVAGIFARRIVCFAKKGDAFEFGKEFGLIRFGSANEIVFPAKMTITAKIGDKVRAGVTVIARKK